MAGGLEKNIVLLANHLARCGNQVFLITFDLPGANPFYEIEPSVQWHQVARTPPHSSIGFWQRLKMIWRIRRVLVEADRPVVVCFHHGVLVRFAAASIGLRLPLICSERNSLTLYEHIRQSKWSVGFLMLSFTKRITVQFPRYICDYPIWMRGRIRVIPNPVFPAAKYARPDQPGPDGRFRLLNVGRLCAQKNQRMLIDAFAKVCKCHPLWDLDIVGDGDISQELAAHVHVLGLANRIFLRNKQRDVPALLASSQLYCMPSKWEGFPNALAEAMAHGLPSIGLRRCAGVRDLIIDGVSGCLADPHELPQALDRLMNDDQCRAQMGRAAAEAMARYVPATVFDRWEKLFREVATSR
jgi:glycosyltransferase involved in cell wall biosynthesis